jgi:hypothetical protein
MKPSKKTVLRILFGFVAALCLFGWVQGVQLAVGGDVSDAFWWWAGALALTVDIVRRRRTHLGGGAAATLPDPEDR